MTATNKRSDTLRFSRHVHKVIHILPNFLSLSDINFGKLTAMLEVWSSYRCHPRQTIWRNNQDRGIPEELLLSVSSHMRHQSCEEGGLREKFSHTHHRIATHESHQAKTIQLNLSWIINPQKYGQLLNLCLCFKLLCF